VQTQRTRHVIAYLRVLAGSLTGGAAIKVPDRQFADIVHLLLQSLGLGADVMWVHAVQEKKGTCSEPLRINKRQPQALCLLPAANPDVLSLDARTLWQRHKARQSRVGIAGVLRESEIDAHSVIRTMKSASTVLTERNYART